MVASAWLCHSYEEVCSAQLSELQSFTRTGKKQMIKKLPEKRVCPTPTQEFEESTSIDKVLEPSSVWNHLGRNKTKLVC